MRRLTWMMVAVSLLAAGPAAAAEMRMFELGFFGGLYVADDDAGVDDDFVYGARAGIVFNRVLELELVLDRVSTTFDSPSFGNLDEEFMSITPRLVFNVPLPRGPIVPYGAIGIGYLDDEVELPGGGTTSDDDLLTTIGGGVRIFVGDNFAFRFEGRLKSFETFSVSQDNFEITAGLTWALGRRR